MQVNVQCPSCGGQYQLNREMIGQKIRCPNSACRQVFEVREAPVEKPRPPKPKPPIRDRKAPTFDAAEAPPRRAPAPVETGPKEADWSAMPPPPVRRREPEAPAVSSQEMAPDDVLAWMHAAPSAPAATSDEDGAMPVDSVAGEPETGETEAATTETDYAHLYGRPRRHWMRWTIVGMFLVVIAGTVVFMWQKGKQIAGQETKMSQDADEAFAQDRFLQAQKNYDELYKKFDKSKERGKYRFMSEFCTALDSAFNGSDAPPERRRKFQEFERTALDDDVRKPLFQERQQVVWLAYAKLMTEQAAIVQKAMDNKEYDRAEAALIEAEKMADHIESRGTPEIKTQIAAIPEKLQAAKATIAEDRAYATFLATMQEAFRNLTPVVLAEYEQIAKKNRYDNRHEVATELQKAKDQLKSRIVFKVDERPKQSPPKSDLPLLIVGAARPGSTPVAERVIFAIARGVLYALSETTGQILWATRVGIDTSALPVRIRRAQNAPELVLVPGADGKSLVARDVQNGKALWMQTFEAPMRSQPILVQSKAFVPLADEEGTLVLVETFDGSRVGYMKLGQKLGPGGAWQVGTSRLFVAAESQNIFVIDTNPKPDANGVAAQAVLEAVLAVGHGAGSLRGEPVVVGGGIDESGAPTGSSYLIVAQSDGLDAMKLRAFELAIPQMGQPVEIAVSGWSWFTPSCDQEKLAIATDAGVFAVFGIAQKGGEDKALFRLVVSDPPKNAPRRGGRTQVVYTDDKNFWYLTNGELTMSRMGYDRKDGQRLAPGWKEPLRLGTPLHVGQVSGDREVLFVVTQSSSPPGCFCTAVEAKTGIPRWQRSLGVGVLGESLRLGKYIYQMDQGGGLYQIDAAQVKLDTNEEWAAGGAVLTPPRTDLVGEPHLLTAADASAAFSLVVVKDAQGTNKLLVRQIVPDQPLKEHPAVALGKETLAGPPALAGSTLYLPLSSGKLARLTIGSPNFVGGPDWKTAALGDSMQGYVTPLAGDDLLVSNGVRGLSTYAWPASGFQFKRQTTLNNRIVAPPITLPADKGAPRIVVADAGGQIQLLDGDSLSPILTWNVRQLQLGSEITAGPYLLGTGTAARILVVVDRAHLACFVADESRPVLKYRMKGDGLAGIPRVIDGALILSDLSGRFEALNAATGEPLGANFPVLGALPAAPAASPIDGGDGRLFAPLTDGSVLVVPKDAMIPKKN